MSASVEGFVETSNNLARIEIVEDALKMVTSQRSTVMTRMDELTARIVAIGLLAGAEVDNTEAYPGWQPDIEFGPAPAQRGDVPDPVWQSAEGADDPWRAGMRHHWRDLRRPGDDLAGRDHREPALAHRKDVYPIDRKVWDYLVAFLKASK